MMTVMMMMMMTMMMMMMTMVLIMMLVIIIMMMIMMMLWLLLGVLFVPRSPQDTAPQIPNACMSQICVRQRLRKKDSRTELTETRLCPTQAT